MSVDVKYTYQDLLTIPNDHHHYELYQGKLLMTPAPNRSHQYAVGNLYALLAESTEQRDRGFKFKRYAQEGVKEYWIVDAAKKVVEVYQLGSQGFEVKGKYKGDGTVQSALLSQLQFPVSEVWR